MDLHTASWSFELWSLSFIFHLWCNSKGMKVTAIRLDSAIRSNLNTLELLRLKSHELAAARLLCLAKGMRA